MESVYAKEPMKMSSLLCLGACVSEMCSSVLPFQSRISLATLGGVCRHLRVVCTIPNYKVCQTHRISVLCLSSWPICFLSVQTCDKSLASSRLTYEPILLCRLFSVYGACLQLGEDLILFNLKINTLLI